MVAINMPGRYTGDIDGAEHLPSDGSYYPDHEDNVAWPGDGYERAPAGHRPLGRPQLTLPRALLAASAMFMVGSGFLWYARRPSSTAPSVAAGRASQSAVAVEPASAAPAPVVSAPPSPTTWQPTLDSLAATISAVVAAPPHAYVVKSGDSLTSVSLRFGISIPDLAQANGLTSRALLYVGQTLQIPPAQH